MKHFQNVALLEDLMNDTRHLLLAAAKLEHLDRETLERQPSPDRWSVAQVLEHLNFYSRHYLTAIEQKLHRHEPSKKNSYTAGWFGDYFTKMMKPTPQNTVRSKMKTMKNAIPPGDVDGKAVLAQFIKDQHTLINLLSIAKTADLGKIRVPTSLTSLLALKLGDTFRFFIGHEQRHFIQIANVLKDIGAPAAATLEQV